MFADFGIPCTIGGVPGVCFLDEEDVSYTSEASGHGGEIIDSIRAITIQTTAFPLARVDDSVQVHGVTRYIQNRLRAGDGALTRILLGSDAPIPAPETDQDVILDGGGTPP